MKKLVMAAAVFAVSASSANAYVSLGLDFFDPAPTYYAPPPPPRPIYVAPRPVYYQTVQPYNVVHPLYYYPTGRDRHRNYDWGYWNRPGPGRGPGPKHGPHGHH